MPNFTRAPAAGIANFSIRLAVKLDEAQTPFVVMSFDVTLVDVGSDPVGHLAGDLAQFLTAQQVTNFTNAALALYAKAKTELLA